MEAAMSSHTGDEWLSLHEAAELLGIHPATVRLWADRNELPSRRTSGGHRRFRRADIVARLRQDMTQKPHPAAQLLVQSVLGRIRFAFTDGTLNTLPWYQQFDENARNAFRLLGHRILELLLQALTSSEFSEGLRLDAVTLGTEYGSITRASHVPLVNAVRAFLYFHDIIVESVLQLAEVRGSGTRDHQDVPWAESLRQIQALTNEILPALIAAALIEPSVRI
jgi:excisionase family DNA binding protein